MRRVRVKLPRCLTLARPFLAPRHRKKNAEIKASKDAKAAERVRVQALLHGVPRPPTWCLMLDDKCLLRALMACAVRAGKG